THALILFHTPHTTLLYHLSLHDALPIWLSRRPPQAGPASYSSRQGRNRQAPPSAPRNDQSADRSPQQRGARLHRSRPYSAHLRRDRKSTRLNSSHQIISYAVFCLKKKIQ